MGVSFAISRTAWQAIVDHAAETPKTEVCGLVFGDGDTIDTAQRAENVALAPDHSFEIDPQALFSAIRGARAGGPKLLGSYHSHPTGQIEPSERDLTMALDRGRLWLIVANGEIAAWRCDEPGRLAPVELSLVSDGGQRQ